MKLKDMTKEELELLTLPDLTELILKENKKAMNTPSIFKEICSLLGYSDEDYSNKIGDFYTSLTTDCRFLILDNAEWDIRDNHIVEINLDEDFEEEQDEEKEEDDMLDELDDIDSIDEQIDDDLEDDDLEDLAIVDEDEEAL